MKRKLVITVAIIVSMALMAGAVNAAVERDITIKKLGGKIGDFFKINGGLIVNSLQVKKTVSLKGVINNPVANKPVTIADDLRVDGRVWTGAKKGPGDGKPFVIEDDVETSGNLSVKGNLVLTGNLTVNGTSNLVADNTGNVIANNAGSVSYDNSISGLSATTVKGAIDEIGIKLSKLVSGAQFTASGVKMASVNSTTWNATTYGVCTNTLKSATATVTFTPSESDPTTGTWTSVGYNIFNPGASGSGLCFGSTKMNYTFSGSYTMIEDMILTYNVTSDSGTAITVGYTATAQVRGNKIVLSETRNSPQLLSILTRQ